MKRFWWLGWFLLLVAQGGDWRPMFDGKTLTGWSPTPFGGAGEVEVVDGSIVLHQGILTGVNFTNSVPTSDYEIELEARRTSGLDFFCGLTFPVGESFASWIVGGWGGAVVGISSLDGADASHNSTTKYHRFETGRWYRLRLTVTTNRLEAAIDGELFIQADIRGVKVGLRPGEIELSKPLGIAAWNTTSELRNIRLRTLDAAPEARPAAAAVPAEPTIPSDLQATATRLFSAMTNSPSAYDHMAQLCDRFGPRFSGSTNLEAAIDWLLAQMKADGLENVHGETVTVPHWVRGEESAELLAPRPEKLVVLGLGGTVATPPEGITAPVLVVTNFAELQERSSEARGRIVVFEAPYTDYGTTVRYRYSGAAEAAKAGAVASLIRSVTPFSLKSPHTGMMAYDTNFPSIPHGALAPEDSARLARWQARGERPVIRLKLADRLEPPTTSRNVIAEVRGREHPEEVVVVGGHIDSWDVGQGAQDDGGNCMAAWEVLRVIKKLGIQPRRTIRLVLWTNEENGTAGARGYRDAHGEELLHHVAAIEADSGVFPPAGFGFTGSEAGGRVIRSISRFLSTLNGAGEFALGAGQTDIAPLIDGGVPLLGLRLQPNHYFWYHHTAADTVDKVDPSDLRQVGGTLAVMTYLLADLPDRLPR
jgi:carboxypeptidase Q